MPHNSSGARPTSTVPFGALQGTDLYFEWNLDPVLYEILDLLSDVGYLAKKCKDVGKRKISKEQKQSTDAFPQIHIHHPPGLGKIPRGGGATASGRIE